MNNLRITGFQAKKEKTLESTPDGLLASSFASSLPYNVLSQFPNVSAAVLHSQIIFKTSEMPFQNQGARKKMYLAVLWKCERDFDVDSGNGICIS